MSDEDSRESATPSPTFCEGIERQDRVHRPNVDYGGDTEFSCCSIQSDALFSFDTYKWEDDDSALRSAAIQSRLPYDKMTDHELKFFPEFANQGSSLQFYLFVRNKILTLWHLDPLLELTFEAVLKEIPPPFNSDKKTLAGIHSYLQRYGLINYGVFMDLSKMKLSTPKRVIVIGAGIAGLAAARQLKFFGFEVTVLEGRRRIGGRIMTLRKEKNIDVDLGANIIQGIVGNPIVTLLQQMPLNISKFETQCPLFDNNGKPLDPRRTEMLRKSFLRILNAAKLVASQVTQIAGRKLSLGETIEHILSQHNLRVQNRRLKFWKKYIEIYTKLDHVNKKMAIVRDAIQQCMSQLESLSPGLTTTEFNPEKNNPFEIDSSINDEEYEKIITMRSVRQIIVKCIEQYEQCEKEHREIQNILIDFKNMEPSQSYLNVRDFRIFNWFLAGIEYMVGTSLNNCSLRDWNNGEKYLFEGSHMTVREGMGALIDELSRDLEVKIDHVVEGINYSNNNNVMVTCSVKEKCDDESDFKRCKKNFFADAVLCTVPLGILKRTPRTNEPSKADVSIRFEPDLPELKRKAIANIGFGTINKLVLLFDHSFWEDASVFGRLSESVSSRGEFFLFIASEDKDRPFIVCLMVGASSMLIPKINEEMLVTKAIAILTQIFGTSCPRRPRHHAVTIWERDRFSCGAGSYSHPGTNLSDFERIKDPLYSPSGSSSVFFAGEHTASQYLGTIHGAFISGLRAAAEIADSLIGLPVSAATTSAPPVNVVVEESTVAQTSYSSRVGMTLQEGMHTLVNPNIPKRPSPTNGENKNPSSPS